MLLGSSHPVTLLVHWHLHVYSLSQYRSATSKKSLKNPSATSIWHGLHPNTLHKSAATGPTSAHASNTDRFLTKGEDISWLPATDMLACLWNKVSKSIMNACVAKNSTLQMHCLQFHRIYADNVLCLTYLSTLLLPKRNSLKIIKISWRV